MISLENIGIHFPQGYLFSNVNLQINKGDRIGLTGKNGAGKSTLLKVISENEKASEGQLHKQKNINIGFLNQDILINSDKNLYKYIFDSNELINKQLKRIEEINGKLESSTDYESDSYLELLNELDKVNHEFQINDGYKWEEKIATTLSGLGFEINDYEKEINSFSGGWKMRAELCKILVNKPDVILLDEPTNHLDILSISWLENYLSKFDGAVITISHDRQFLDNVTNRTIEISNQKAYDYPYNFSKYQIKRNEELERLKESRKDQEKEIKKTQELIDKFRAKKNKAAFAQSLIKKLDKTEIIEIDDNSYAGLKIKFPLSVEPGKLILELENVGKKYDDNIIFKNITLNVSKGEKIALLGANGVGKSTLIKRIMNEIDGEGDVKYGHNVNIAYFSQNQAEKLDPKKTVLETIDDIAEGEIRKEIRSILGSFLFNGEDVDKKVAVLSGGERTRLALCTLLLSPSNFLILDEPTNHLDIVSKEILKSALQNYKGSFIVVSHDREFLDGLSNKIWDIQDKGLKIHHFDVKEFLKMKNSNNSNIDKNTHKTNSKRTTEANEVSDKKLSYEATKELKRKKNQLNNQLKKIEKQIEELEDQLSAKDSIIEQLDYSDEENAKKQLKEYEEIKQLLDTTMNQWEEVSEEIISIESL